MLTVVRVSAPTPGGFLASGPLSQFVVPHFEGDPVLAKRLTDVFVGCSLGAWSAMLELAAHLSEAKGHLAPVLAKIMDHPEIRDSDDENMHYTLVTLAAAMRMEGPTKRGRFLGGEFAKFIWYTSQEDTEALAGVLDTLLNLTAGTWAAHLNEMLTSHVVPHEPDSQCALNHAMRAAFGPGLPPDEPDPSEPADEVAKPADPLPTREASVGEDAITHAITLAGKPEEKEDALPAPRQEQPVAV